MGSPCCPRDSQESSSTPQFKSTNSLSLIFLCGPTLTSIHDYWQKHSFDKMDFVSKVMSLVFNILSRFVTVFIPRSKCLFNFTAAVTICSDFGAQENEVFHYFPLFPHLFAIMWWDRMPWSSFFKCWVLSQLFHFPLSLSSRGFLVPLPFLP